MSYRSLSSIVGLKSKGHVGKKIKAWVHEWGDAGEDTSILDLTEEFLEKTCPQAFKNEGLEKVCAIPDGKGFKIFTPRQNMLFSRACYLDKVYASAVRCISWCTPLGLSFEHTDLYLARPGEKTLLSNYGILE